MILCVTLDAVSVGVASAATHWALHTCSIYLSMSLHAPAFVGEWVQLPPGSLVTHIALFCCFAFSTPI